jgi:hypothetical protein
MQVPHGVDHPVVRLLGFEGVVTPIQTGEGELL